MIQCFFRVKEDTFGKITTHSEIFLEWLINIPENVMVGLIPKKEASANFLNFQKFYAFF